MAAAVVVAPAVVVTSAFALPAARRVAPPRADGAVVDAPAWRRGVAPSAAVAARSSCPTPAATTASALSGKGEGVGGRVRRPPALRLKQTKTMARGGRLTLPAVLPCIPTEAAAAGTPAPLPPHKKKKATAVTTPAMRGTRGRPPQHAHRKGGTWVAMAPTSGGRATHARHMRTVGIEGRAIPGVGDPHGRGGVAAPRWRPKNGPPRPRRCTTKSAAPSPSRAAAATAGGATTTVACGSAQVGAGAGRDAAAATAPPSRHRHGRRPHCWRGLPGGGRDQGGRSRRRRIAAATTAAATKSGGPHRRQRGREVGAGSRPHACTSRWTHHKRATSHRAACTRRGTQRPRDGGCRGAPCRRARAAVSAAGAAPSGRPARLPRRPPPPRSLWERSSPPPAGRVVATAAPSTTSPRTVPRQRLPQGVCTAGDADGQTAAPTHHTLVATATTTTSHRVGRGGLTAAG